jgi:hypothetical protein
MVQQSPALTLLKNFLLQQTRMSLMLNTLIEKSGFRENELSGS